MSVQKMPDEPRDVGCSRWGKSVNTCLQIRTLSCIISQNSCTNQQYNNHIHFLMSYNSSEFKLYSYDIQTIYPTEWLVSHLFSAAWLAKFFLHLIYMKLSVISICARSQISSQFRIPSLTNIYLSFTYSCIHSCTFLIIHMY